MCVSGETIQFNAGSGPAGCPAEYTWQFENGPVDGSWTINHQFPNAGTYNVQLTIIDQSGSAHLARRVTVVGAAAIPMFSAVASLILLIAVTFVALIKLG
jgi:PKD repeat protein